MERNMDGSVASNLNVCTSTTSSSLDILIVCFGLAVPCTGYPLKSLKLQYFNIQSIVESGEFCNCIVFSVSIDHIKQK